MKNLFSALLAAIMAIAVVPGAGAAQSMMAGATENEQRRILVMLKPPPVRYRGGARYSSGYNDARSEASREQVGRSLAKEIGGEYVGFWQLPEIGLDCVIIEPGQADDLGTIIAALEQNDIVEWAEPVEEFRTLGSQSYNDPLYPVSPAATQWHIKDLHRTATGRGVTIAVVDSGVDADHPDLTGQTRLVRSFVEGNAMAAETHGTAVAGIIAAIPNNRRGMVGIAPGARILGLRACREVAVGSVCDSLSLARAIHFAIERDVDILNLSLSGPSGRLIIRLLDQARRNGTMIVAAVDANQSGGGFPASHSGVIAVNDDAAQNQGITSFGAPGRGIPTTQPNARWYLVSGSSYSAAHVSGLLALMIERRGRNGTRSGLVRQANVTSIDPGESLRRASAQ